MKNKTIWILIALFSLILNGYLLWNTFSAKSVDANSKIQNPKSKIESFVCPMHPQVIADHPSDCPICGMKLVKKQSGEISDPSHDSLISLVNLSPSQELLANIAVEHPVRHQFDDQLTVAGVISQIEGNSWKASVRAMGRIEKLYVSNAGESVRESDPLFDLYSPDIASAVQEYLYILDRFQDDTLGVRAEAARGKLLSLGLEIAHLNDIDRRRIAFDVWTFHAPRSGVVMEKMASPGIWVMPGMVVIDFLDLATVYVEGNVLSRDASKVVIGAKVEVVAPNGKTAHGEITLSGPMVDMMTRTHPFRAVIDNSDGRWTPGEYVTVNIAGKGGYETLSLPEDAVLITGNGAYVWTLVGQGRFAPRAVLPGKRQDGRIAIVKGLDETDAVAVSGAYLIDSDAQLRSLPLPTKLAADEHFRQNSQLSTINSQPNNSKIQNQNSKFYSCPMHPKVVSSTEGRCPECGMFLVESRDD